MKIKWVQKDQIDNEKSIQPEETDETRITKKNSCEKCCLNFSSEGKLKKHQSDMHKAKLTF